MTDPAPRSRLRRIFRYLVWGFAAWGLAITVLGFVAAFSEAPTAAERAATAEAKRVAAEQRAVNEAEAKRAADAEAAAKAETERHAAEAAKAEAAKVAAAEAEKCRQDLMCLAEKHLIEAGSRCAPEIERLAQYTAKWNDGMFEPKFSHYRWKDQKNGVVTYIGGKVEFQNGFGAWSPMVYECDFNTVLGLPMEVRAEPGRL
jgi:nucleoid-associated protein YgaU